MVNCILIQSEQDDEQDVVNAIIVFCIEPKPAKEINRLYFKKHFLDQINARHIAEILEKACAKAYKGFNFEFLRPLSYALMQHSFTPTISPNCFNVRPCS